MTRSCLVIALTLLLGTVSTLQGEISSVKGRRMYNKITANLMVNDVGETLDFYERILGFNMVMAVPENSRETITARRDDTAFCTIRTASLNNKLFYDPMERKSIIKVHIH